MISIEYSYSQVIIRRATEGGLKKYKTNKNKLAKKVKTLYLPESIPIFFKRNNKFGLKKNKIVIVPSIYDTLIWIDKGVGIIDAQLGDLHGVIDTSGKIILAITYNSLEYSGRYSMILVEINMQYGIVDFSGKTIIEPTYMELFGIGTYPDKGSLNLIRAKTRSGLYYLFDVSGKRIYEYPFDWIDRTSFDSRITFQRDGKYGFFDETGVVVIQPVYAKGTYFNEGLAGVEKDGIWGYIDHFGNTAIEFKYLCANAFKENRAAVKIDGKWGYINSEGNMIVKAIYEDAQHFSEGKAFVAKFIPKLCLRDIEGRNYYGVIDLYGKVILPFIYEVDILDRTEFKNGVACRVLVHECDNDGYSTADYGNNCIDINGKKIK